MEKKLDQLLDIFEKYNIPGFDCLVMHNGKEVYRRTSGFSNSERTIPVSGKEVYNLYSCSKVVTCVAALQLFEQGKFLLEDKLSDYLPEFATLNVKTEDGIRPAKTPLLIKHLFTMTSGYNYVVGRKVAEQVLAETDGKCPTREFVRKLAEAPLLFDPGERWEYGLSHDILVALVEVISGERFSEYVKKNIFEPLGMINSTFMLPDEKLGTVCAQYAYDLDKDLFNPVGPEIQFYKYGTEYESGGAGLVSTVEDYIKLLEALRIGDIILKNETIDLMTTNMLTESQEETFWKKENYHYGLGVRCPKAGKSFDFGWGGAAGAFLMVDRTNNITAFYAQHVLYSPNALLRDSIAAAITEDLIGVKSTVSSTVPEEVLKQFL